MDQTVVRWVPGMKLNELERQVVIASKEYFPSITDAAASLGISLRCYQNKLAAIKKENEDEERSMDALVAQQNEAILRFKRMAAPATVRQEKIELQKTFNEDAKVELPQQQ